MLDVTRPDVAAVLAYAERRYIQNGHSNSGCLHAGEYFQVELRETMLDADTYTWAVQALVDAGVLVRRSSQAETYMLSAERRVALIEQHKLRDRWLARAAFSHPTDPQYGEIARAYREAAVRPS